MNNKYKQFENIYNKYKDKVIFIHYYDNHCYIIEKDIEKELIKSNEGLNTLKYLQSYNGWLKRTGQEARESYFVDPIDLLELTTEELFKEYKIEHKEGIEYIAVFI